MCLRPPVKVCTLPAEWRTLYLTFPLFLFVSRGNYIRVRSKACRHCAYVRRKVQMSKSHVQRYVKNSTPKGYILENIRQLTDIYTCFIVAYFKYINLNLQGRVNLFQNKTSFIRGKLYSPCFRKNASTSEENS